MAPERLTAGTVSYDSFPGWLVDLSRRRGGRALSTPTAMQMAAYMHTTRPFDRAYKVTDAQRAAVQSDRHKLRRVIVGTQWDGRGLLHQAARQAIADRRVDALLLGSTTISHGEHDDTILDLHALVEPDLIPIGWRRLRDERLRQEARVAAQLIDEALSDLGIRPTSSATHSPPAVCADLLGDEGLRALLAAAGIEYVIAMPSDYAGASLTVDVGTFWRKTSVLGYDLRNAARTQPVRLRVRPDTRVLDVGGEWAVADHTSEVPTCWVVHPVLRGAAATQPLRASREQQRATELAELRRRVPSGSRAAEIGANLFNFDSDEGWERDVVLRSLDHIFELLHA